MEQMKLIRISINKRRRGLPCREKLVASKANQLLIVVDETKLVQNLNQSFPLPVEVLPNAWKQVQEMISEMNGSSSLRMATKKAGCCY